jgi:hypothetical protein
MPNDAMISRQRAIAVMATAQILRTLEADDLTLPAPGYYENAILSA